MNFLFSSYPSNKICDAGIIALAAALDNDALPKLRELYLQANFSPGFGGAGVKALLAAAGRGKLSNLQVITLDYTDIGEEGVEAIAETIEEGNLPSLTHLTVDDEYANLRLTAACIARGIHLNVESEAGSEQGEDEDESEEEDESESEGEDAE